MGDLGGTDRKVEWAEQHISDLQAQLRVFRRGKPYEIMTQENPEDRERSQMVLRIHKPIPDSVVLRVGDAVHNLRSALDHLACLAVEHNSGPVSDSTAFPIWRKSRTPTMKDLRVLVHGKVNGASAAVIKKMLTLQPYEGGADEPLWCVDRLDIIDKHRLMISALASYESLNIDFGARMREEFGIPDLPSMVLGLVPQERFPLYDGYVLYEAPTEEIAKGNPKFTIEVSLGEPKVLRGKPVVPMLTDLAQAVRAVVDLFRSVL